MEPVVEWFSLIGSTIFDPFLGTGNFGTQVRFFMYVFLFFSHSRHL